MLNDRVINTLNKIKDNKTIQVMVLILVAVIAAFLIIHLDLPAAQAFIRANRRQATIIGIGVYFLLGFTFIPASPLTLFLAVLLGPVHAVLIAVVGNTLAALLEYQIGVVMGDVIQFEDKISRLPFGLSKLPITSPYLLMAGRLLPLGKRGFSIVCGAYHVPTLRYLWTTVVMYIINAAFIAFGGTGLLNLIY
jgi:uncharacterized membrane protein YdjX (TVP38/TMEM64 family)